MLHLLLVFQALILLFAHTFIIYLNTQVILILISWMQNGNLEHEAVMHCSSLSVECGPMDISIPRYGVSQIQLEQCSETNKHLI